MDGREAQLFGFSVQIPVVLGAKPDFLSQPLQLQAPGISRRCRVAHIGMEQKKKPLKHMHGARIGCGTESQQVK